MVAKLVGKKADNLENQSLKLIFLLIHLLIILTISYLLCPIFFFLFLSLVPASEETSFWPPSMVYILAIIYTYYTLQ